jgi:hypothetical protein
MLANTLASIKNVMANLASHFLMPEKTFFILCLACSKP